MERRLESSEDHYKIVLTKEAQNEKPSAPVQAMNHGALGSILRSNEADLETLSRPGR